MTTKAKKLTQSQDMIVERIHRMTADPRMSKLDTLQGHVQTLLNLLQDREIGFASWWMIFANELRIISEIYQEYMNDANQENS